MLSIRQTKSFELYKVLLEEYLKKLESGTNENSKLMLDAVAQCRAIIGSSDTIEETVTVYYFVDGEGWKNYGPRTDEERIEAIERIKEIIASIETDTPTIINLDLAYMGIIKEVLTEKDTGILNEAFDKKIAGNEMLINKLEEEKEKMEKVNDEIKINAKEVKVKESFFKRHKGKLIVGGLLLVAGGIIYAGKEYLKEQIDVIEL